MKCSGVDLRSEAERQGEHCARLISGVHMNSYPVGSIEHADWVRGFKSGQDAVRLEFELWKQSQKKVD